MKTTMSQATAKSPSTDRPQDISQSTIGSNADSALSQLIERTLARSGMSYATFVRCVTQNAFRSLVSWSESDLERLLLVCEALGLSPAGRDVYAVMPQGRGAAALLAVSVDGWARIVNQHPQFDGMEFEESNEHEGGVPSWIRCTIYRKDRRVALSIKEYMCEAARDTSAWKTHPRRMLRHKALVQCARLAFELPTSPGVYDTDEAERIVQAQDEQSGGSWARHTTGNTCARKHNQSSEAKIEEEVRAGSPASEVTEVNKDSSLFTPNSSDESARSGTARCTPSFSEQPVSSKSKSHHVTTPLKRRGPSSTQMLIGALTR
jgi:phage recombination protein Bet